MRLLSATTFDRANATEQQSARVQRRALKYVMQKAGATWKPSKNGDSKAELGWTRTQGYNFINQIKVLTDNKVDAPGVHELLELLRDQVEYLELCIDVNKMGESNEFAKLATKVVGHIDLSKPDSKPDWDKE